jgi:hypothetical protein
MVGFLLITLSVILGELTVAFDDYVYFRLGLNRNLILLVLWSFPCLASFIVAYYSDHKPVSRIKRCWRKPSRVRIAYRTRGGVCTPLLTFFRR